MPYAERVNPRKLNHRHRALMRELISGATQKDAARHVGMSELRVSQLANSELFKIALAELREKVEGRFAEAEGGKQAVYYHRERLGREIGPSIDTLTEIRDEGESEGERRRSAMDILSMTQLSPKGQGSLNIAVKGDAKIEVNKEFASFLQAEVERRGLEEGDTIEAEVIDVRPSADTGSD